MAFTPPKVPPAKFNPPIPAPSAPAGPKPSTDSGPMPSTYTVDTGPTVPPRKVHYYRDGVPVDKSGR